MLIQISPIFNKLVKGFIDRELNPGDYYEIEITDESTNELMFKGYLRKGDTDINEN